VINWKKDYELNGPMVPNIPPKEAMERLRHYAEEYALKDK